MASSAAQLSEIGTQRRIESLCVMREHYLKARLEILYRNMPMENLSVPIQSQEVPLQVESWKCCHLRSAVLLEFSSLGSSNVAFQNQTNTAAAY